MTSPTTDDAGRGGRRVGWLVAVAALALCAACGEAPTGASAARPEASRASDGPRTARQGGVAKAARAGRRGGYNVVAD